MAGVVSPRRGALIWLDAHNAYADTFRERYPGALVMMGPFPEPEDGQPGALSIFTSREAAEEFATSDPFVVNEVVKTWRVRKWLVSAKDSHVS